MRFRLRYCAVAQVLAGCADPGTTSEDFCRMVAEVEADAHLGDLLEEVQLFCGLDEHGDCVLLPTSREAVDLTCDGCRQNCNGGDAEIECAADTGEGPVIVYACTAAPRR
ncbi:MAG: hypothetical protein ABIO70_31360 [Pseudomonadota bacterium]